MGSSRDGAEEERTIAVAFARARELPRALVAADGAALTPPKTWLPARQRAVPLVAGQRPMVTSVVAPPSVGAGARRLRALACHSEARDGPHSFWHLTPTRPRGFPFPRFLAFLCPLSLSRCPTVRCLLLAHENAACTRIGGFGYDKPLRNSGRKRSMAFRDGGKTSMPWPSTTATLNARAAPANTRFMAVVDFIFSVSQTR